MPRHGGIQHRGRPAARPAGARARGAAHQCTLVPVQAGRDHQPGRLAGRHAARRRLAARDCAICRRRRHPREPVRRSRPRRRRPGRATSAPIAWSSTPSRSPAPSSAAPPPRPASFARLRRRGAARRARLRPRRQRRARPRPANLTLFRTLPHLAEVSIGHALMSHALFVGLRTAVRDYLAAVEDRRDEPRRIALRRRWPRVIVAPAPAPARPSRPVQLRASDGVGHRRRRSTTAAGGPAPAVVLVHMLTRTKDDWRPFAERLQAAGRHRWPSTCAATAARAGRRRRRRPWRSTSGGPDVARRPADVRAGAIAVVGASLGAQPGADGGRPRCRRCGAWR